MKRLSLYKHTLLVTTYTAWASFLTSLVAWSVQNHFSPHAGKLFILAVAVNAAYYAFASLEADERAEPIRLAQQALRQQAMEAEQAGHTYTADCLRMRASNLDSEITIARQ